MVLEEGNGAFDENDREDEEWKCDTRRYSQMNEQALLRERLSRRGNGVGLKEYDCER